MKRLLIILAAAMMLEASACKNSDNLSVKKVDAIADQVWVFSQSHPDGFTLDIRTMTEPTEGIAVSYAATQGNHSREQLPKVVEHALSHDGYIGGWLSSSDSLYYFDSTRLFPEDSLDAAIQFGKDNGQYAIYILSSARKSNSNMHT